MAGLGLHEVFVVDSAGETTIEKREQLPWVRIWDENWNLARVVQSGWRIDEPNVVVLPWSDPLALWLWRKSMLGKVLLTVDQGGMRWCGRVQDAESDVHGKYVYAKFERHGVEEWFREAMDWFTSAIGVPRISEAQLDEVFAPLYVDADLARSRCLMDGSMGGQARQYLPNLEA